MTFVVDTDAMHSHARQIDQQVERLDEAIEAARQMFLPDNSFGVLCAFFIPPALAFEAAGLAATVAGRTALAGTANAIDGMADSYDFIDDSLNGAITEILEAL